MSSPLDVSSRAVLYGRTPVGLGTPLVESLTGFLSRISFARALLITNVLHFLVRPLVPDGFLRPRTDLSRFLAQTAVCYDGLGLPARTVVPALERLTGLPDLALHTCLPWAGLLSRQSPGAVRYARKRWCARCLSDWHRDGVEPWDPLLWRLAPVVRCPIHRTPLSERCPACGHTVNLVTQRVPPGHCEHCGAMLHEDDPVLASGDPDLDANPRARLQWWIALAAGRMLCAQREACSRASPAGVVHLVEDARVRYARGGVATLARHLGMSSTRLKHWSAGTRGIRLSPFVEACVRLGVDPVHVAFGPAVRDASPAWSPWGGAARPWPAMRPIPRSASYRQSRAARWREVGRQIDRLLASGTPPPLRETARDLGVGLDALQRSLPGHYQRLVSSRAEQFSKRRERAREALDRAISGEEPRSLSAVSAAVSVSHTLLRKWFPERCVTLVRLHAERTAHARARALAERCRAVSEAVRALRAAGERPSLYRALLSAGLPDALLSNTAVRAAWLQASNATPHRLPRTVEVPLGRPFGEASGESGQDCPGARDG